MIIYVSILSSILVCFSFCVGDSLIIIRVDGLLVVVLIIHKVDDCLCMNVAGSCPGVIGLRSGYLCFDIVFDIGLISVLWCQCVDYCSCGRSFRRRSIC